MPNRTTLSNTSGPRSSGKIGVLIEEHFDATEFKAFNSYFPAHGFTVEYLSHLWGNESLTFRSNAEGGVISAQVTVTADVEAVRPADYVGLIAIGGYAMDRLRYQEVVPGAPAPGVEFLRAAMDSPGLTLGAVCHGLWLWCALPQALDGRRVTCAHNIVCDVRNAGGLVMCAEGRSVDVVVDGNLVTASHPDVVDEFMAAFVRTVAANSTCRVPTASHR
jgi:protease I